VEQKKKKFVINLEFEVWGEALDNVVTTCPQLNLHTEDSTIQGALEKLFEGIRFAFQLVESRHELEQALDELEVQSLSIPPWAWRPADRRRS